MRDFFYSKSDILVALLIIVIAAVVIYYRVTEIMEYPQTAKGTVTQSQTQNTPSEGSGTDGGSTDNTTTDSGTDSGTTTDTTDQGAEDTTSGSTANDPPIGDATFIVTENDSLLSVTENLYFDGLITDKQAFLDEVTALQAEEKFQTGTFNIPEGTSAVDIIHILIGE